MPLRRLPGEDGAGWSCPRGCVSTPRSADTVGGEQPGLPIAVTIVQVEYQQDPGGQLGKLGAMWAFRMRVSRRNLPGRLTGNADYFYEIALSPYRHYAPFFKSVQQSNLFLNYSLINQSATKSPGILVRRICFQLLYTSELQMIHPPTCFPCSL